MARILITGFCSIPSPGRPGVQLGHIIDGLRRQHQVDVLSVRRDDQGHVEHLGETRYLRVPLPEEELAGQIAVFRRALRRQVGGAEYDVVHFRDGWSGVTALEMQSSHGFATVFDLARSPTAEPVLTDLATATELERAEQTCVRRADLILAPTEPSRQYLAGFTSESKIHVVPPGVNVDRFDWEALNLDRAPIVLYLGTLAPGRGVRVLLRSMLDVASVSNAVLVLAGPASASFQASLESAVLDLGLEGRVRLLGEIPHALAPAVIARATVCVAPGAAELSPKPTALFPTKLLEYMACRRAVVAPARGTVKMLFRDGEEGLMFTPGAPDELAKKILLLLRDSKLRNRLANAGYEMVRANCTASGTRRSLRRAYGWLAEQAAFRQRLGQPKDGDPGGAPITELGLDLILRQHQGRSEEFAAEELSPEPPAPVHSPAMEAGDVTRVEMLSVRDAATPTEPEAVEPVPVEPEAVAPIPVEVAEEGTEEWDIPLAVIEDTGSMDLDDLEAGGTLGDDLAAKPKTVVTAPLDDSMVSGELPGKPARPEHQRPVSEGLGTPGAVGSPAPRPGAIAKIPPAHLRSKAPNQGLSAKRASSTVPGSSAQDNTRVLAAADLEEMAASDGQVSEQEQGATRVVRLSAADAAALAGPAPDSRAAGSLKAKAPSKAASDVAAQTAETRNTTLPSTALPSPPRPNTAFLPKVTPPSAPSRSAAVAKRKSNLPPPPPSRGTATKVVSSARGVDASVEEPSATQTEPGRSKRDEPT